MNIPKQGISKNGKPRHYSVGMLAKNGGKYFLIDRAVPPFGFAGVAGHIDKGETPEIALAREVREESNLKIKKQKLLFEEELDWNWCSKDVGIHYWYLFSCEVSGVPQRSKRETKSAGWYTAEEIKNLPLEPVWKYWFKKIHIL